MDKKEFQQLLQRYRNGHCSKEEIQKIDLWFDRIEDGDLELSESERQTMRNEILDRLQSATATGKAESTKEYRLFPAIFFKVAAAVTLFLAVGYYLFLNTESSKGTLTEATITIDSMVLESALHEVRQILLPDGSSVSLQPTSKISYARHWDEQKRVVYLVGEAFFEIVKDNKRPFFVHGGDVVTKVLGTSFNVRALPNAESIEVKVNTGKVSVYEASSPAPSGSQQISNGVVLLPNQQVKFYKENKQWVIGLVDEPKPLHPIEESNDFVFDDTSLKSIITQIEKDFSIQIIVEQEGVYGCTFTGDVSKMELFDMLEVICKSIGVTFEVKGTIVLITGKGCA